MKKYHGATGDTSSDAKAVYVGWGALLFQQGIQLISSVPVRECGSTGDSAFQSCRIVYQACPQLMRTDESDSTFVRAGTNRILLEYD